MTGWSYTSADGHPGFCTLHPIQSGVDAGATAIRPMTPTEGAIYHALQGYMQVHPRMQDEIDRLAASLAAAEAERDALALRVGERDRRIAELEAALETTDSDVRWFSQNVPPGGLAERLAINRLLRDHKRVLAFLAARALSEPRK